MGEVVITFIWSLTKCAFISFYIDFTLGSIWVEFLFIMTDLFASFHCHTNIPGGPSLPSLGLGLCLVHTIQ